MGSDKETEKRDYNEARGKEPINPEDIAVHEPTAVKRDQDTEIAGEGERGADSPETCEKYRKKGMFSYFESFTLRLFTLSSLRCSTV
ncbi:MAG: hypothetical protein ACM31M_03595 [Nitrososphaerota archaeon]